MIRKFTLALSILLLLACNKQQVKITGAISNGKQLKLNLDEIDVYRDRPVDSVLLKKSGRFRFCFKAEEPSFYQLRLPDNRILVLFPSPGEHIRINADAQNLLSSAAITGSEDSKKAITLALDLNKTKFSLDSLNNLYKEAKTDSLRNIYNKEYQSVINEHRKRSIAFILKNSNSMACLYALYEQYSPGFYVFYKTTDLQFFRIVSDSLSKYFPKSKHVIALRDQTTKMINDYKTQVIMQKFGNVAASLPKIELPNENGKLVSLQSLKGKFVLLNFWASWSQEGVSLNMAMKGVYKKYKSKGFEILDVSFDSSVESWIKEIHFDELPWINLIDASFPKSEVATSYNITEIPTNFLIDKDNVTILAKNLSPSELKDKLAELCK